MFVKVHSSYPHHDDCEIYVRREAILTLREGDHGWEATVFTGAEPMTVYVNLDTVKTMIKEWDPD